MCAARDHASQFDDAQRTSLKNWCRTEIEEVCPSDSTSVAFIDERHPLAARLCTFAPTSDSWKRGGGGGGVSGAVLGHASGWSRARWETDLLRIFVKVWLQRRSLGQRRLAMARRRGAELLMLGFGIGGMRSHKVSETCILTHLRNVAEEAAVTYHGDERASKRQ